MSAIKESQTKSANLWPHTAHGQKFNAKPSADKPKGKFVISGRTKEMSCIWTSVKNATKRGDLGYFSNACAGKTTIIVFHADGTNQKNIDRIGKKLNAFITKGQHSDILIEHRLDNTNLNTSIQSNQSLNDDNDEGPNDQEPLDYSNKQLNGSNISANSSFSS